MEPSSIDQTRAALHRVAQILEHQQSGIREKLSESVLYALGRRPAEWGHPDEPHFQEALASICYPSRWPQDLPDIVPFYKALHLLVERRGATREAALSVKDDLQHGKLHAVLVTGDGDRHSIPAQRWQGSNSPTLWWCGAGAVKVGNGQIEEGSIYIESLNLGTEPEAPKPLELDGSEALCKLLLHLVGKKSAKQVADNSSGTDYAVSERHVRRLVAQAKEFLAEKAR